MSVEKKVILLLKQLVQDLVNERYQYLVLDGRIGRLTEEELKNAINMYRGKITLPPDDAFNFIDIYPINNTKDYALDFDLWVNGQRSDLTLCCTVSFDEKGKVSISIDDLHEL